MWIKHMVFIDKWSLFGGYTCIVFYLLNCGHYLQGGLYSQVSFNRGLTVFITCMTHGVMGHMVSWFKMVLKWF